MHKCSVFWPPRLSSLTSLNSHSFHCGSATRCRCSRRRSHIMKNRKEKLKFKPKVNIIDDWTDCSCTPHYYTLSYCACSGLLIVNMHNRAPLVCRSMYDLRSLSEKNVRAPYATVSQTSNLRKHVVRFLLQRRQFDFMMSVRASVGRTLTQRLNRSFYWMRTYLHLCHLCHRRHAYLCVWPVISVAAKWMHDEFWCNWHLAHSSSIAHHTAKFDTLSH